MTDAPPPVEPGDITLIDVRQPGCWVPSADDATYAALAAAHEKCVRAYAELDKCKQEKRDLLQLLHQKS